MMKQAGLQKFKVSQKQTRGINRRSRRLECTSRTEQSTMLRGCRGLMVAEDDDGEDEHDEESRMLSKRR